LAAFWYDWAITDRRIQLNGGGTVAETSRKAQIKLSGPVTSNDVDGLLARCTELGIRAVIEQPLPNEAVEKPEIAGTTKPKPFLRPAIEATRAAMIQDLNEAIATWERKFCPCGCGHLGESVPEIDLKVLEEFKAKFGHYPASPLAYIDMVSLERAEAVATQEAAKLGTAQEPGGWDRSRPPLF
jgi:hypothetical protein